jgi:hypothetical protein
MHPFLCIFFFGLLASRTQGSDSVRVSKKKKLLPMLLLAPAQQSGTRPNRSIDRWIDIDIEKHLFSIGRRRRTDFTTIVATTMSNKQTNQHACMQKIL